MFCLFVGRERVFENDSPLGLFEEGNPLFENMKKEVEESFEVSLGFVTALLERLLMFDQSTYQEPPPSGPPPA